MRWTRWGRLFVAVSLWAAPPSAAQTPDPEVAKGVAQVMARDYRAGAFTLDRAVRALSARGDAGRDMAFGYFYEGIAYVGLGNEPLGRLKISQGLLLMRSAGIDPADVTVDGSRFPPEVVRAVADARQQLADSDAAAPAAKSPATTPTPATTGQQPRKPAASPPGVGTAPPGGSSPRSSGGHKGLWIGLGAVAAAGAGVAVLKGGESLSSTPAPAAVTPAGPQVVLQSSFSLRPGTSASFPLDVGTAGVLTATVQWSSSRNLVWLYLTTSACSASGSPPTSCTLETKIVTSGTTNALSYRVSPGSFRVFAYNTALSETSETGTIQVTLTP